MQTNQGCLANSRCLNKAVCSMNDVEYHFSHKTWATIQNPAFLIKKLIGVWLVKKSLFVFNL